MSETWLPIPGLTGYEVSDLGRVRSWRPWRGTSTPRLLKPILPLDPGAYLRVAPSVMGAQRPRKVHQLVLLAFVGPRPDGMEVRHLDGDRLNNRLDNLAYGTRAENAQDTLAHGRNCQAVKTTCIHGHPFDQDNTIIRSSDGARICRTCANAKYARYHARRKVAAS